MHTPPPGGEDYESFKSRVMKTMLEVFGDSSIKGMKRIAVVSHGGFIRCFFREALGKEFSRLGDCSMILMDSDFNIIEMWNAEMEGI